MHGHLMTYSKQNRHSGILRKQGLGQRTYIIHDVLQALTVRLDRVGVVTERQITHCIVHAELFDLLLCHLRDALQVILRSYKTVTNLTVRSCRMTS